MDIWARWAEVKSKQAAAIYSEFLSPGSTFPVRRRLNVPEFNSQALGVHLGRAHL
jgi:hypothetical protein